MRSVLDEVVRPDVVGILRPQADARPVRKTQLPALGLFRGDLQPLASPAPLDPLVIDRSACLTAQQLGDLAIAVAAILPGELDDVGGQPFLIVAASWDLALRRAMLPERAPGLRFGDRPTRVPSSHEVTPPSGAAAGR